ncbi:MAG TPA: superoxide dismutase family protein [Longimicrobiales bacterium]
MRTWLWLGVALAGCASGQSETPGARARFIDSNGQPAGEVSLFSTSAGVRVTGELPNLPSGAHGFHFHAVGNCQTPGFESAGAHFNPTNKQHGLQNPNGPHQGDMPNVSTSRVNLVVAGMQLNALLDSDGAAIVLHANPDDLRTDPSGNSGARIRCGVVERLVQ